MRIRSATWLLICLTLIFGPHCTGNQPPPVPLQISLFGGINKVARLGDPESVVMQNQLFKPDRESVSPTSDLGKLGITASIEFDSIGVKAFIRRDQVVMLEVHDRFPGTIDGRTNKAFGGSTLADKTWEETLVQAFGYPHTKATGGRLGSAALFYSWGDISYNRVGPNEYAIYQAPDIAAFREKNFGQDLSLFKTH